MQDNGNDNDDDKDIENGDDMSDTGPEVAEPIETAPSTNNNKEAEDRQSLKVGKKKKSGAKGNGPDSVGEDGGFVEVPSKRKDSAEMEVSSTQSHQSIKKSSPPPVVTSVIVEDSSQLSNRGSKRKKENAPNDSSSTSSSLIIPKTVGSQSRNGINSDTNVLDTLKEVMNLPSSLKSLSPTSVTSPKKPIKREEGWKEVVRRGPVSSRENSSSNLGTSAGAAKKSQSSDRSSATLSVIQSSERSKKVTVPSNAISRVIGRAGCNINAIREISGAHIEIEKQGKGQGDRTVLIKGLAESIRQAQQLITALIKEPEKEFNELMTKFRAANAAAKAGTQGLAASTAATQALVGVAKAPVAGVASGLQPKVTRAVTTIASSKPSQSAPASGLPAPVPSTVAWGAINTLIVSSSPSKRPATTTAAAHVPGTKTPPVTSSALMQQQLAQQQQQKSTAVRQLFPDSSPVPAAAKKVAPQCPSSTGSSAVKPSVSYTVAGSAVTGPTTSAVSARTTPVVSSGNVAPTRPTPQQAAAMPAASKAFSDGKKQAPTVPASPSTAAPQPATSQAPPTQPGHPGQQQHQQPAVSAAGGTTSTASSSSRPGSTSPVQDYSPFNNLFSKVAQQSMWAKEQQKSKNFASVAATGVNPQPSKVPSSVPNSSQSDVNAGLAVHVVDAAKAPGYRGNLNVAGQSQMNEMSGMDVQTSLTSSAPGTPIPSSGPIRAPVGSRLHPLTPPPRMGSPPLFNPTPIQPLGPVGTRHMQPQQPQQQQPNPSGATLESIMVPPPSAASLAPGGPSAIRMRAARMQQQLDQPQQHPPQFEGLPMPNFYGVAPPSTGQMERPAFSLAPGMGGPPRYILKCNQVFKKYINWNANALNILPTSGADRNSKGIRRCLAVAVVVSLSLPAITA